MNSLLKLIYTKVAEHKLSKAEALALIEGLMASQPGGLHPLLQRNTSDLDGLRFSKGLRGDAFYLKGHQVRGQKVLPAVAYLEMARTAVCQLTAVDAAVALHKVVWLRPLTVDQERQIHIRLNVTDDSFEFEIYADEQGEDLVFCQGSASLIDAPQMMGTDLAALREGMPNQAMDGAACYAAFAEVGIAYGAAHRAIETLYSGDQEVLAKLSLTDALHDQDGFHLHPGIMDAALQATIGLTDGSDTGSGQAALPFALERFEALRPTSSTMWAWVRHTAGGKAKQRKLDVDLYDDQGQLCARFKGLVSRQLDASAQASESQALHTVQPVWKPMILGNQPLVREPVLIIGGTASQVDAIRSVYTDAEQLDLAGADMEQVLAALQQPFSQLIWIAPDQGLCAPDDDAMLTAQERGVIEVFRIAKALLQLDYGVKDLSWTLITTQSVTVDDEPIHPQHAGVHGLIGSLAKEYPRWRLRTLDMQADQPWPVVAMLSVPAQPQGEVLAWRDGQWHTQSLQPVELQASEAVPYRTKGVYVVIGGAGGIGAAWSQSVVENYDAQVIWLGRRAEADLNPVQRQALKQPNLHYMQADATDRASLQAAYDQIVTEHGQVHGLIHAALVLQDQSLAKMSEQQLRQSLAAKVEISVRMAQVFATEALDFVVFFSSMNSFAKAAGQSNYAAGCAFKDAFAQQLASHWSCAVKTINWGFWGSVGVAADAAHNQRMAALGVGSIEPVEGMQVLETLLASPLRQLGLYKTAPVVEAEVVEEVVSFETPKVFDVTRPQKGVAVADDELFENAVAYFGNFISKALKIPAHRIDPKKPLENYGLDSILSVQLTNGLGKHFDNLSSTLFFEVPTINALVEEMLRTHKDALVRQVGDPSSNRPKLRTRPEIKPPPRIKHSEPRKAAPVSTPKPIRVTSSAPVAEAANQDVAIIGLSGRFPQADDLETFWDNLVQGADCISEVPPERWDMAAYFDADKQATAKSYSKWGGFISDVDSFDPLFFKISPREANLLDPMQRLFLETVWNLLESQGYTRQMLAERYQKRVGVYVGAMYQQYHAFESDLLTESVLSLSSYCAIANRVSNFFDLQGPSVALDTMCSSSLTAIKMAYESLRSGESKLAIAGGVNLTIHPKKYIGLSASSMIASHADSRSFADGDGYLPAEAVGAVLLKPLAQAEADGDRILALIKGVTANHGGFGTGYSVPNPQAQMQLMRDNFEQSGIDPRSISYLESAVNGSALGDPIEINTLNRFFNEATSDRGFCAIGAVKANIGHAEAASGITQLAKVLLQLQHQTIAPSYKAQTLNPKISFADSAFYLPEEAQPWAQPVLERDGQHVEMPRRAAISSFGAAGANVHMIVEEYAAPAEVAQPEAQDQPSVIVLSARSADRLPIMCANLLHALKREPMGLTDVAYTLQLHREAMEYRLAFVVESREALLGALEQLTAKDEPQVASFRGNSEDFNDSLLSGETGKLVLQAIMSEGNLAKIAEFWAQGGEIPWAGFYPDGARRPLALPTYPFAKQRYWVNQTERKPEPLAQPVAVVSAPSASQDQDWRTWLQRTASSLLQIDAMPMRKRLDALGYGSLDGVQLKSAFEREFGVTVPAALFHGGQTLEALAQALEEIAPYVQTTAATQTSVSDVLPVIEPNPADRFKPFPLSDIQESYLIGRKLGDKDAAVGCHIYLELEAKQLDIFRLNAAWKQLVADHDMLRTVFLANGQQQVLADTPAYEFKVLDLRRKAEPERRAALEKIRDDLSHKLYPTDTWPLFDIRVSVLPQRKAIVHFSIDELLLDWSGIEMLFAQWQHYYQQPEQRLPQPSVSFRDYMIAVKQFEGSQRYQQDLDYWLTKLDGMPGAPMFVKDVEGQQLELRRSTLEGSLAAEQWQTLKAEAQALGVSTTALLLSVFCEVLRIWNKDQPFSLIMTYFNRLALHPDLNRVLGPFISTNLFLAEDQNEFSLAQVAQANQADLYQDLDHGNVSGIRVMRELKKRKQIDNGLSLPVVFTSLLGQDRDAQGREAFAEITYSVSQTPQVYLDHQVHERAGTLHFNWDVVKDCFEPGLIDALFADYCAVLERLAAKPEQLHSNAWRDAVKQERVAPATALIQAKPEQAYEPFPQTDQQQAYAFGRSRHGGNISSQVYMDFEAENLDLPRLEAAWHKVMQTHEMLRVVVHNNGTQQLLQDPPPFKIRVADLSNDKPVEVIRKLAAVRDGMLAKITPLGEWPYFDIKVSQLSASKCRVHFSIDMIIADGTSVNMLAEALFYHYQNPATPLQPKQISFRDYVMYLHEYRKSEGYRESSRYWRDKFADIPGGPALPAYRDVTITATERFEGVLEDWGSIKRMANQLHVQPGMVLLAVYAEVLGAWAKRKPFTLVVPCWQRLDLHPELERMVGDFTAMSWISADLDDKPFAEKVRGYHSTLETDLSHMAVSGLSMLRRVAMKQRGKALSFPMVFTNLAKPTQLTLPEGFTFGEFLSQTSQVHIDCISLEDGERLNLHWDVAKGLFPQGMIGEMFGGYERMLASLTDEASWQRSNFDDCIAAKPDQYRVANAKAMEEVS